jgi:superoxide dismutase
MHFKLYEGYVTNTNLLNEQIAELGRGEITPKEMPVYSELTRRLGFEYNGMVLHEWYFGNLKKNGGGAPDAGSAFVKAAEASFGSFENWKKHFRDRRQDARSGLGRNLLSIPSPVVSPTTGSIFTRPATSPASARC